MKKSNCFSLTYLSLFQLVFMGQAFAYNNFYVEKLPYLDPVPPISSNQSEKFVSCPLSNSPSSKFMWRGEEIEYSNNRDVNYDKAGWPQRVSNRWTNGFLGIVPPKKDTQVAVIDIRQVKDERRYFYLGDSPLFYKTFEPLSSSKFIATLNMARRIREESAKKYGSEQSFGLNAYTDFNEKWGQNRHLGEFITWQHSYELDESEGLVSNMVSQWFGALGVRSRLNSLIGDWLFRPTSSEYLYAGYGQPQNNRNAVIRTEDGRSVTLNPVYDAAGLKSLSTVTIAETLRRVVEMEAFEKEGVSHIGFPSITKEDAQILLYGAPTEEQGGMQKGIGVYLTEALGGKENLDEKTNGEWRIFTKIGLGSSVDFVLSAAVCLPHYEGGRSFVIAVHTKGSNYKKEDAYMYEVVKSVTDALVPGFYP